MNTTPSTAPHLESIYLCAAAGDMPHSVAHVEAIAGVGLAGDRYAARAGSWSAKPEWWNQLTLIEAETLAALEREHGLLLLPGTHRRNLVTRGVALNELIGREFWIGSVHVRGVRSCDPCRYLDEKTQPGVREALRDRGGLRADILTSGPLRPGDPIRW